MYKRIFLFSLLLSFFLFILYFVTPKECLSKKVLYSLNELGFSSIKSCYSSYKIKESIKQKLSKNKLIYDIAAKIKISFFKDFGKSRELNYSIYSGEKTELDKSIIPKNILALNSNELDSFSENYKYKPNIYKNFNSWKRSHANNWNNKFFETNLINKLNVSKLKLIWKYSSNQEDEESVWRENIQANPVFNDGIIYFLSSDWSLNAIDILTGQLIWKKNFIYSPTRRGFLINQEQNGDFIYITSGERLFKLDSKTGKIYKKFGENGTVSVGRVSVAPVIYKNEIILVDTRELQISSYSIETGKLINKFPIHPKSEKIYSVPWGGSALDEEKGYFYFVTGNPKPTLYGVNRPGNNLNSNSLIAYDLNKKKIVWIFQEVMHDLWDYDIIGTPCFS